MAEQAPVRNSQRMVLACTSCARRKIKCSKTIPCNACIQQNKATSCRRESVSVVTRRSARQRPQQSSSSLRQRSTSVSLEPDSLRLETLSNSAASPVAAPCPVPSSTRTGSPAPPSPVSSQRLPEITNQTLMRLLTSVPTPESRLTPEATVALDFLAHGRRNVLNRFVGRDSVDHLVPLSQMAQNASSELWDTFLPVEDARMLLALHQAHLTWMHNVVHLPTFRQEFDENVIRNKSDKSWRALYYALLSHTLHHIDHGYLASLPQPIPTDQNMSRALFDKSIELLNQAEFMDKHKLTSVQAVCLLQQLAYNFDKSDLICVLISAAIRISQCLDLHRLGPDQAPGAAASVDSGVQRLINREVRKRVWWFLVRFDWLEIPFQSTCQIHPDQFNTPMPVNCYDDIQRMIKDEAVVSQPDHVYTSSSWSLYLNHVSVITWKHQDRMSKVKYPSDSPDSIFRLYDTSIWADQEIKSLFCSWQLLPRDLDDFQAERAMIDTFPVDLLPDMILIFTANRIMTVHRHFQLSSFRDKRFAFSQLSCVTIAERSIEAIQRWPDNLETRFIRRMWTTLTHVMSCSITLVLALLFKSQCALTHDLTRIRRYVAFAKQFISQEEQSSSIARRGVRLLNALMNLEECSEYSMDLEADIGDMVRRVAAADGEDIDIHTTASHQFGFPNGQGFWEALIGEPSAGDFAGV